MSNIIDRSKRLGDVDRAYDVSRRANLLVSSAGSKESLLDAAQMLDDAAVLFERAAIESQAEGVTSDTLQLLAAQHQKRSKDVRRQASRPINTHALSEANVPFPTAPNPASNHPRDLDYQPRGGAERTDAHAARRRHTPAGSSASQPPFARNVASSSADVKNQLVRRGVEDGSASIPGSTSSSERGGESYVVWGDNLDSSDPFARFWSKLETAFDEISKPIAFTSMPLDIPKPPSMRPTPLAKSARSPEPAVSPSSSGSFCVVKEDPAAALGVASLPRPRSSNQKTVEELELENASLKTGLDTMSHHAQLLADELKAIRAKEEKREELMKSVVLGVRMEAQRAMQSQELRMSQLLSPATGMSGRKPSAPAPTMLASRAPASTPQQADGGDDVDALRLRILELEGELVSVQSDNERMRGQLQKYKDRFERIRTSARARKEAKLLAAGNVPSTPLATLGEEDNEA